jgi:hypothetical protein
MGGTAAVALLPPAVDAVSVYLVGWSGVRFEGKSRFQGLAELYPDDMPTVIGGIARSPCPYWTAFASRNPLLERS